MRQKYEMGFVKTASEFKEVLEYVLSRCKG